MFSEGLRKNMSITTRRKFIHGTSLAAMAQAAHGQSAKTDEPVTIESVAFEGLRRVGYLTPRRSEQIRSSRWSINLNNPPDEDLLERTASAGAKWARIGAGEGSQKLDTEDSFASLDKMVNGLVQRKIQPWITVFEGGGIIPRRPKEMPDTSALDRWGNWVRALASRYKDRVHYWEIWNEPNEHGMPPAVYVELAKRGSTAIRGVDPGAKIVVGSLALVDTDYLKSLFDLGIAPYGDIVAYHPYAEIPEASAFTVMEPVKKPISYMEVSATARDLRQIFDSSGKSIALWQGECGYPSADNSTGGWTGRGPWGERIQAKWILRRMLTDLGLGVELSNIFVLVSGGNKKSLLYPDTRAPKPGLISLGYCASIFDNRFETLRKVETAFRIVDAGIFYGALGAVPKERLTDPGRAPLQIQVVAAGGPSGDAVAYWLPWRMQELIHPAKAELKLSGARIQDPVVVNLLDGDVYQAPVEMSTGGSMNFSPLPLADYPFAIVGRSQIQTQAQKLNP
jgi:hypothetical protein